MEYTSRLFVNFIKSLIVFDKDCRSAIQVAERIKEERDITEKNEWDHVRSTSEQQAASCSLRIQSILADYHKQLDNTLTRDFDSKSSTFNRLHKCKEILAEIASAEKSILYKDVYDSNKLGPCEQMPLTAEDLLNGNISFIALAYILNETLKSAKKKNTANACASFYTTCRAAESILEHEIISLRSSLVANKDALHQSYSSAVSSFNQKMTSEWTHSMSTLNDTTANFIQQRQSSLAETKKVFSSSDTVLKQRLEKLVNAFHKQFPPREFANEYTRIYSQEPSFTEYECFQKMPRNVHISTFEYDISHLGLSSYSMEFLYRYYAFMIRGNKICIPCCASFGPEFNYLFRFDGNGRQNVVKSACDLGMRLFMMLPPGKLKFTFIDPVTLGESFAMFARLVDVDDRTSEVINGKIWSSPEDIEQKLKIMTDHISNITQRCLQGKYRNIYEYNRVAEQNAEAYQVLMLMDFPAGLTDHSLKLLEQIATSGPKCGVFTLIYRNESQYKKVSERSHPLIKNIESSFHIFDFNHGCTQISCSGETVKNQALLWRNLPMPGPMQMDQIIATLKKGIKNAERVVIGIEKVSKAETTESTTNGIRIPIGLRGANEVQYLTLGVGGSHHALIAGVAGSGKSSLLHTIILRTLTQYSPDELSIYLVDFKRGVEFKIYADFELPSFKVVAIESEREFGYNILLALDREQKIRADLFKKNHVDKIEEYRALGKKMPRILVIMDEFHELFSNASDDIAKKSALLMERIVRQGRAFGVHMILASQSYSNITGVDRAVVEQMAVRIVLKCSKADANLLLDNGSTEIDQISIDDPGRAVYNSEAGNKEYNSHFRVAYINPSSHRDMLQQISEKTISFADQPTRILLSNIEDNKYSIFNQFSAYDASRCPVPGRLYIGEPLSVTNDMNMDLVRRHHSNLLLLGPDTEKARSMFAFAILSLCINYRVRHGRAPDQPFIYLLNCKPLNDSYFKDTPKIIANELLPEYVRYIHCGDEEAVQEVLADLHSCINDAALPADEDRYFFAFGYQRAEELKSELKLSQSDDLYDLFNLMPSSSSKPALSPKEIFHRLVKDGAKRGVHTILWQDSYSALEQDDNSIMSYFNLKVAFDMSPEEFSRSVGANDISMISENNAIYYNKATDNQNFRPYQAPDEDWLRDISAKLH